MRLQFIRWVDDRSRGNGKRYVRLVCLPIAELSSGDLVQYVGEGGALLLDWDGVVSVLVSKVFHGRSQVTEENYAEPLDRRPVVKGGEDKQLTDVLIPNLLANLNIRTVNCPNQQSTVQAELHV